MMAAWSGRWSCCMPLQHYVLDVTVLQAEAALERAGLARRRPDHPRRSRSLI